MEIKCSERCGNLSDENCRGMCIGCFCQIMRERCDKS
jgi:hypothetical protein